MNSFQIIASTSAGFSPEKSLIIGAVSSLCYGEFAASIVTLRFIFFFALQVRALLWLMLYEAKTTCNIIEQRESESSGKVDRWFTTSVFW